MSDILGVMCPCGWRAEMRGGEEEEMHEFLSRRAWEHAAECDAALGMEEALLAVKRRLFEEKPSKTGRK